MSKNTWGNIIPERYSSIYKNPTPKEMRDFSDQVQDYNFRWAACHLNKVVVVWSPEAEIHERMVDFLKNKGIFPRMSEMHYSHQQAYQSDYIAGYCKVDDSGKMEISHPQEGFDWSDYNRTIDWKFLKKYFTNSRWGYILGDE
jgi:hypothetical protein